jgi:hypothetical protein
MISSPRDDPHSRSTSCCYLYHENAELEPAGVGMRIFWPHSPSGD